LVENARKCREENELIKAGNHYAAAAHEYQGTVTNHRFPELDQTYNAVSNLQFSATCYRVAGDGFRTQNRCDVGVLLAEDYLQYADSTTFESKSFAALRRGAWPEFIGDLRTIAGRDNAGDAYDRAASIYESAGGWEFCMAEQEHMRLAGFFKSLKIGLNIDIPEDALENRPLGPTFVEWLEYKRERLPDLLDNLESQGSWPR
jgi:hypothetical protein